MLRDRRARHASGLACAIAAAVLLSGCLTPAPGPVPEPSPAPTTSTPLPELPPGPAGVCTQVLNDRDSVVDLEAGRASEDVYTAVFADEVPSASELSRWRRKIEAGIAQTTAELEILRSASTDPAWAAVLIPLEESLANLTVRLDLTNGPWPVSDDATLFAPIDLETDVDAALASLGMTGRDCESLAIETGPASAFTEFVASAAITCSAIVDRRRDLGYPTLQDTMFGIVDQVVQLGEVAVTEPGVEALRALVAEWEQTAEDLAAIPGKTPDDKAWAEVEQIVQDRIDFYTARLAALESGDPEAIAEAFTPEQPDTLDTVGKPDFPWPRLDLDLRDCRSIEL